MTQARLLHDAHNARQMHWTSTHESIKLANNAYNCPEWAAAKSHCTDQYILFVVITTFSQMSRYMFSGLTNVAVTIILLHQQSLNAETEYNKNGERMCAWQETETDDEVFYSDDDNLWLESEKQRWQLFLCNIAICQVLVNMICLVSNDIMLCLCICMQVHAYEAMHACVRVYIHCVSRSLPKSPFPAIISIQT